MEAVYNNLISSYLYARKPNGRRQTIHGESELKSHYNDIISLNKKSPIYIVRMNETNQEYILGLKDRSMSVMNEIEDYYDNMEYNYSQKKAVVDDSRSVKADIVSDDYERLPDEFDIHVKQMASKQRNRGNELYDDGKGLAPGRYSFNVRVNDHNYSLRYTVGKNAKNIKVMNDIAKMINREDIGIRASIGRTEENKVYMRFESDDTGDYGENIFEFSDNQKEDGTNGIVNYYGLNKVIRKPKSLIFDIDGEEKRSMSNNVILNKSLELSIKGKFEGNVHVGYLADGTKAVESFKRIINSYNDVVEADERYRNKTGESTRLMDEFRRIYGRNEEALSDIGVSRDEAGYLEIDEDKAMDSFAKGKFQEVLSKDSPFLNSLLNKNKMISLNPVEYTRKLMVSYPDYSKEGVGNSYMTSIFSGMLFNYYC